ncbi:MAG: sulfate ABC transporter permease, partial [Woeseiaceae bacterium]
MAATAGQLATRAGPRAGSRVTSRLISLALIGISLAFLSFVLIIPVASVLTYAFSKGFGVYLEALATPDTISAIRLTLMTAFIVVPVNTIFGVAAAWAIAKFDFRGKQVFLSLIDLPFSVSPVVAGLVYVLLLGPFTPIGAWLLQDFGVRVIFAVPGVVLATIFVTFPFVARELIPLMQDQGTGDEEAALSLGASGWQTFFYVTLPNVKWALLYGVLL